MKRTCPAQLVAEHCGLSVDEIARRADIHRRYFMDLCRNGRASDGVANLLEAITGVRMEFFVWGYRGTIAHGVGVEAVNLTLLPSAPAPLRTANYYKSASRGGDTKCLTPTTPKPHKPRRKSASKRTSRHLAS